MKSQSWLPPARTRDQDSQRLLTGHDFGDGSLHAEMPFGLLAGVWRGSGCRDPGKQAVSQILVVARK